MYKLRSKLLLVVSTPDNISTKIFIKYTFLFAILFYNILRLHESRCTFFFSFLHFYPKYKMFFPDSFEANLNINKDVLVGRLRNKSFIL